MRTPLPLSGCGVKRLQVHSRHRGPSWGVGGGGRRAGRTGLTRSIRYNRQAAGTMPMPQRQGYAGREFDPHYRQPNATTGGYRARRRAGRITMLDKQVVDRVIGITEGNVPARAQGQCKHCSAAVAKRRTCCDECLGVARREAGSAGGKRRSRAEAEREAAKLSVGSSDLRSPISSIFRGNFRKQIRPHRQLLNNLCFN